MTMMVTDPLLRREDHSEGVSVDNTNVVVLKPENICQTKILSHTEEDELLKQIKDLRNDHYNKTTQFLLEAQKADGKDKEGNI
jgi:hypothetical protein